MPAPTLKSFAADLYDRLTPMAGQDAAQGYDLAYFLGAIGEMFQKMDDYGRDQDVNGATAPGWSQLVDINRCPTEALPWLGQFVGVSVPDGLTADQMRTMIQNRGGWSRGTVASIVAAAQSQLTGTKTVTIRERDPAACPSNPAYGLTVLTRTAETANSAAVLAAMMAQKPAGIVLNYQVLASWDYQGVFSGEATYTAMYTQFLTYQGVLNDQPGT